MNQEDLESTVRESLTLANVPKDAITQAINKLREAFRAEKEERASTPPKAKTQLVALVDDPEDKYKGQAFVGWILKLEESAVPMSALDRAKATAHRFNNAPRKRGKKVNHVKDIRETFAGIPNKWWKGENGEKAIPQNREPIVFIPTNGSLT